MPDYFLNYIFDVFFHIRCIQFVNFIEGNHFDFRKIFQALIVIVECGPLLFAFL